MKNMNMNNFKERVRKRMDTKIEPFKRFPLMSEKREIAHDALNHTREALGLRADIEVRPLGTQEQALMWSRIRLMFREPFLEFWGAFIMVLLGDSVNAQTYLSNQKYGSWLNVCLGWSCAYMFGIYIAGDSGAYLNPAVTLTNCLFRGLPLRRFPTYAAAQFLGSFFAHGVTYGNYISAFDAYEGAGNRTIPPNPTTTARIFCTFPADEFLGTGNQVFSEFLANFVNLFCIFAMRDENGADLKGGGWFVLALFWLNFGLISSLGWLTGSPVNPARDLTGRLWLTILGYHPNPWSAFNYYSWIPLVIPFFATMCGAIVYDVFIYTGDSPINTPGMGLGLLVKCLTCGYVRPAADDEEKARSGQHTPQISGDSGETKFGSEEAAPKRSSTEVGEVQEKNKPWDQPRDQRESTHQENQITESARDEPGGSGVGAESYDMGAPQQKATSHDSKRSMQSHGMGDQEQKVSHDTRRSSSREEKFQKLQQKKKKDIDYDRAGGGDNQD